MKLKWNKLCFIQKLTVYILCSGIYLAELRSTVLTWYSIHCKWYFNDSALTSSIEVWERTVGSWGTGVGHVVAGGQGAVVPCRTAQRGHDSGHITILIGVTVFTGRAVQTGGLCCLIVVFTCIKNLLDHWNISNDQISMVPLKNPIITDQKVAWSLIKFDNEFIRDTIYRQSRQEFILLTSWTNVW